MPKTKSATSTRPELARSNIGVARAVDEALKKERGRIALELHDTVNAHNVALRMYAETISFRAEGIGDAEMARMAHKLEEELQVMYCMARNIVNDLLPELEPDELIDALTRLASNINIGTTKCELNASAETCKSLSNAQAMSIYRVAQEATSNALKHAQAKKITIDLVATTSPRRCQLTVSDDGRGFDATQSSSPTTMGLKGMQRRASAIGGLLRIASNAKGSEITLIL